MSRGGTRRGASSPGWATSRRTSCTGWSYRLQRGAAAQRSCGSTRRRRARARRDAAPARRHVRARARRTSGGSTPPGSTSHACARSRPTSSASRWTPTPIPCPLAYVGRRLTLKALADRVCIYADDRTRRAPHAQHGAAPGHRGSRARQGSYRSAAAPASNACWCSSWRCRRARRPTARAWRPRGERPRAPAPDPRPGRAARPLRP